MKLLQRTHAALASPGAQSICLEQFRAIGKIGSATAEECAIGTFAHLKELLVSEHGIRLSAPNDAEIARFVKDASTKDAVSFTAAEYQELMKKIVKFAALRANHCPRRRWTLGVGLSAAAAVAISAALPVAASSAALMVSAAPVGAVVGALALGIDSRRQPARDRRRATRHKPRKSAPAAAAAEITAAEEVAFPAEAPTVQAACAPVAAEAAAEASAAPAVEPLATSTGSGDLVSAVIEVLPPAASAVSPFSKDSQPNSGLPVKATAAGIGAADADDTAGLPDVVRSASPQLSSAAVANPTPSAAVSVDVDAPAFDDHVPSAAAQLPPLATKKSSGSKALKKSFSKGFKSMKKALSLSSSTELDAVAAAAVERADGSLTTPTDGKPPKGNFILRRSFSRDSSNVSDKDSALNVQASEGSATLRKMREALRRSFDTSLRTPKGRVSTDSAHGAF